MEQNYILEIDGKAAGRFFAFSGGGAEADVVSVSGGSAHKHIGSVKYHDIVLTCGSGMSRGFYDWIGTSFGGANMRKSGSIVALDQKQAPSARLDFANALVTSLALPELDRSANKAAYLKLVISPEHTRSITDPNAKPGVYSSALPKAWNISDFRLTIYGLENDCKRVTHIDSLILGRKLMDSSFGESRSSGKEATSTEYPNLEVRLPDMNAAGFYAWLDDFVVKGNNGPDSEKKGVLEFFAPNSTKDYFGLELSGLGIYKIEGSAGLRQKTSLPVTVGMYCESMKFYAGAAAII
jgi:phage tail-like protein